MEPAILDPILALVLELRRELAAHPEASGAEKESARIIRRLLHSTAPDELVTGVGGCGVVAAYGGAARGPTVLLRAELDAVPAGAGLRDSGFHAHRCGHDGHMAALAGVAMALGRARPARGRVVLLFQPAEETGRGAARVLADPGFAPFVPDMAFALHNLPGVARHTVVLREGCFAWASVGMVVSLRGETSHAAHPEHGRSPTPVLARLLTELPALTPAGPRPERMATIVHTRLGTPAFGTAPGEAELMITLRAESGHGLRLLRDEACRLVEEVAGQQGLGVEVEWVQAFDATNSDPACVASVAAAAAKAGLDVICPREAFRWSEDFGAFTARVPGALIGIGAGGGHPQLHHPDYEFPDELLPAMVRLWMSLVTRLLEREGGP